MVTVTEGKISGFRNRGNDVDHPIPPANVVVSIQRSTTAGRFSLTTTLFAPFLSAPVLADLRAAALFARRALLEPVIADLRAAALFARVLSAPVLAELALSLLLGYRCFCSLTLIGLVR
eukprot:1697509-Rhodomonas_salina.3